MLQSKTNQKSVEQIIHSFLFLTLFLSISLTFLGCSNQKPNEGKHNQFKVRALWVDPPGFADRETVDRLIDKCQLAGINMLILMSCCVRTSTFSQTIFLEM